MKLKQVFDPTPLLDGDREDRSADEDPLAKEYGLATYFVQTGIKGLVYGGQTVKRLAPLVLPLLLTSCTKDTEEVREDVRAAVVDAHKLGERSCEAIELHLNAVLDGRGYEPDEQDGKKLLARGVTVSTSISDDAVHISAENPDGELIIMKSAHCKSESLQQ